MPKVNFTAALKRFFPDLEPLAIDVSTVVELITYLENHHPGIGAYLLDEQGALREHVNIFIGENLLKDRVKLSDKINPDDEVYVMQALSGG